jgi:GNAT superfamily N-acetyltransferase
VPIAGRTIRVAQRPDARAAAAMLARAFDDDPVMMWIFPDEQLRRRRLPVLFGVLLRRYYLAHRATELVLAAGDVLGCGMWAPPGGWMPPVRRQLAALPGVAAAFGSRFLAANSAFGAIARLHPREPHWYLAGLGTDPPAQGTGVGRELLRSRLARCDMTGAPAYLESSKESNVGYYETFGFAVTREIRIPGGPALWPMWRPPRRDQRPPHPHQRPPHPRQEPPHPRQEE